MSCCLQTTLLRETGVSMSKVKGRLVDFPVDGLTL
jgi:hypothetical protein